MRKLLNFRPTLLVLLSVTVSMALLIGTVIRPTPNAPNAPNIPKAAVWLQTIQETIQEPDDEELEDEAKIVLKAPTKAQVGELVQFDLSESVAQSFKWILVPESVDFVTYNGGERAVFSARKPGTFMFIVTCAYDGTCDAVIHIVTIEGAVAPDPVVPDPNIVRPGANADLNEWVVYWCIVNKLPKIEATRLAISFESVAAQIAAGVLLRADSIITTTARANKAALGGSLPLWMPILQELQTAMKSRADRGILSTPDQHQALWLIIARGLHTYAKG